MAGSCDVDAVSGSESPQKALATSGTKNAFKAVSHGCLGSLAQPARLINGPESIREVPCDIDFTSLIELSNTQDPTPCYDFA